MRTRKFDPAAMAEAFLNAAKMLQGMANEQPTQNIAKVKKSKKAAKDKKPAKKGGFVAFLKDRNEQRNAEQNPKQRKAAMDCARKHPTIDDGANDKWVRAIAKKNWVKVYNMAKFRGLVK